MSPLDKELACLDADARGHLGEVRNAEDVLGVAANLLRERESPVATEWAETGEPTCRLRFGETGAWFIAGHGPSRLVAAVRCFVHVWQEIRYLPSLPTPSTAELRLIESHHPIRAIESYMNRVGVGLGIARRKLQL